MDVVLIWIIITGSTAGAIRTLVARAHHLRLPLATLIIALVTFVTSAVGNISPPVLSALARDRSSLADGQWWRIITPLLVQDGGWPGTAFNIIALLVLGTLAESLCGSRILVAVYAISGFISEIAAYTILQHQGFAGNSVAVLGLGGLISVVCIQRSAVPARIAGAIVLLAGISLLIIANLHGVGTIVGAVTGFLLSRKANRTTAVTPVSPNTSS